MKIIEVPATNCKNCGHVLQDGLCPACGTRMFYVQEDEIVVKKVEVPKPRPKKPEMTSFGSATKLMVQEDDVFVDMFPIKSYMNSDPCQIETTTLDSSCRTYVHGIQSVPDLLLVAEYNKTVIDNIEYYKDIPKRFAISFGSDGKFTFVGCIITAMFLPENAEVEIRIEITDEIIFERS